MKPLLKVCYAKLREWGAERCLRAVVAVLIALLLLQAGRYAFAGHSARSLAQRLKAIAATPERTDRKPFTEYALILDKGLLGKKEAPRGPGGPGSGPSLKVFGVLGNRALVGNSSEDAKLFEVGKPLPNGETLAEVNASGIVLEKDGKKHTLTVFPGLGAPPRDAPSPDKPKADGPPVDGPPGGGPPPAGAPPTEPPKAG